MNKTLNYIENGFIVCGTVFGLENIENILGIIILCVQIVIIIAKFVIKVIDNSKKKDYNKIVEDSEDLIKELENIKNTQDTLQNLYKQVDKKSTFEEQQERWNKEENNYEEND